MLPSLVPSLRSNIAFAPLLRSCACHSQAAEKNANSQTKNDSKQAPRGPQLRDDHFRVILEECFNHGVLGQHAEDGELRQQKEEYILGAEAANARMPAINEDILAASKNKGIDLPTTVNEDQCKRTFNMLALASRRCAQFELFACKC